MPPGIHVLLRIHPCYIMVRLSIDDPLDVKKMLLPLLPVQGIIRWRTQSCSAAGSGTGLQNHSGVRLGPRTKPRRHPVITAVTCIVHYTVQLCSTYPRTPLHASMWHITWQRTQPNHVAHSPQGFMARRTNPTVHPTQVNPGRAQSTSRQPHPSHRHPGGKAAHCTRTPSRSLCVTATDTPPKNVSPHTNFGPSVGERLRKNGGGWQLL